jgi:hypothetical protein
MVYSRKLFETSHNNPSLLQNIVLLLDQTGIEHSRQKYGLFDLLGDLGGVTEVIMIFFGFFLYPISEHSFVIKAAKKLFYARTYRDDIFVPKDDPRAEKFIRSNILTNTEVAEVKRHKTVILSIKNNIILYLVRQFEGCLKTRFYNCISEKNSQLLFLWNSAQEKIENDLDVIRIIKHLREIRIAVSNQMINEKMKFQINHHHRNVINIENEDHLDSDDSDVNSDYLRHLNEYLVEDHHQKKLKNRFLYKKIYGEDFERFLTLNRKPF